MPAYKPPHYLTLGCYIMVKTSDGKIAGVPITVTEIGEEGIGAQLEKMVNDLTASGLIPITQEEHDTLAREWLAQEQAGQLAVAMRERAQHDAVNPERADKIIASHKGRPGGDA